MTDWCKLPAFKAGKLDHPARAKHYGNPGSAIGLRGLKGQTNKADAETDKERETGPTTGELSRKGVIFDA